MTIFKPRCWHKGCCHLGFWSQKWPYSEATAKLVRICFVTDDCWPQPGAAPLIMPNFNLIIIKKSCIKINLCWCHLLENELWISNPFFVRGCQCVYFLCKVGGALWGLTQFWSQPQATVWRTALSASFFQPQRLPLGFSGFISGLWQPEIPIFVFLKFITYLNLKHTFFLSVFL